MSIIHDALKKVQSQMGQGKTNPEDIVEIIPSENSNKTTSPKPSAPNSLLIVLLCVVVIGISLYMGYLQIQKTNPDILSNIKLPRPEKIQRDIVSTIKDSSAGKMIESLQKKQPEAPKPLTQVTISPEPAPATTTNPSSSAPLSTNPSTTISPSPTTAPVSALTTDKKSDIVLNIQGVMANTDGNVVLINNNVYAEGETVDGAKIIKISLKEILIEYDGQQKTIPIKK